MPESPRWLVKVGREEEGRYILGRLRGETGADEGRAEAEFQDIRNIVELERKTSKSKATLQCSLALVRANFTQRAAFNWSSGSRSCKNGLVSLVLPSTVQPSSRSPVSPRSGDYGFQV